jgi:hypothetical protein
VDESDFTGATALHYAAMNGRSEVAEYLISRGASLKRVASGGQTALHYAARKGHIELIKLLVKAGADPSLRDWDGATPDRLALARGHNEASALLLDLWEQVKVRARQSLLALKPPPGGARFPATAAPVCLKCGGNGSCDRYDIVVVRALKAEFKSSMYGTSASWTIYSSSERVYRSEATLAPSICKKCQAEVYKDAFIVKRFRPNALLALIAFLAFAGACVFSYINYIFGAHSNTGDLRLFIFVDLFLVFGFCISLGNLFFKGFISMERACAYALEGILKDLIKYAYDASEVRTCGSRVVAPGEIELFTEGDWELLKNKSEKERKEEEQNEKWREEMRRTGHWPGHGFFYHLVEGFRDEGRDLSESPFSEWLRSARRRAREKPRG